MNTRKHTARLAVAILVGAMGAMPRAEAQIWNRGSGNIGDYSASANWSTAMPPNGVGATTLRWQNTNALINVDTVGGNPPTIGYMYGVSLNTTVTLSGGTLQFNSGAAEGPSPRPQNGAFINPNPNNAGVDSTGKITLNNPLSVYSGNGNMHAGGAEGWVNQYGTIVFANSGNAWKDTYILNNVTAQLGTAGALPSSTVVNLGNSTQWGYQTANTTRAGILDLNGYHQTVAGLQIASGNTAGAANIVTSASPAVLTVNNSNGYTFAGTLAGAGLALRKMGSGDLILTNSNSYLGDTTISSGTLKLGSGGSFANSPTIVVGDASSSGAVLDLTSKSSFAIGAGQTLKGKGTVLLGGTTALTINGLLSPGNSPGLLTYDGGGTVALSGTTLMEVWGTSRGTNPGYDAIDLLNGTDLTFGGILQLDFNQLFADGTSFNLFTPDNTSSLAGTFSSISMVGSFYTDLSFTNNAGVWTTNTGAANQSMTFNSATGTLSIIVVPEPAGLALLASAAIAGWPVVRRRRRAS